MTIAQHKIKQYCKDNNISMPKLSAKLGYAQNYIWGLSHNKIAHCNERKTIEEFFGIENDIDYASVELLKRYRTLKMACDFFNRHNGLNVKYSTFWRWCNGVRPKDKAMIKAFCNFAGVKNEWIDDYCTV